MSNPEDRIERLLAVAAHPTTPYHEATTALEGARKVAERFKLLDYYGLRIAGVGMMLSAKQMNASLAPVKASLAIALQAFEKIRRME